MACKPNPKSTAQPTQKRLQSKRFKFYIQEELRDLKTETRPASPIIESLAYVASDFERDNSQRMIVLVSDLMEHSSVISMYSDTWLDELNNQSEKSAKLRPMLKGIDMTVLFMTRAEQTNQTVELLSWWRKYLKDSKAFVERILPITG